MTKDEYQYARMTCLELAAQACGCGVDCETVLQTAQRYYNFVTGTKAKLHVVANTSEKETT